MILLRAAARESRFMKIAFVTLYDQTCPGARYIASSLLAEGHDVHHLHFKRQRTEFIPRPEEPLRPELKQDYRFLYVAKPEGNYYFPFPTIVTERERELFVDWIEQNGFEAVAFSLLSVFASLGADLSQRLRRRLPQVKIVWGGVHVWFNPEESLKYADAVCIGEGEHAMIEFCADPGRTDIQNLWFNDGGRIARNPKRPLFEDLDALPFASFGHNEHLLENDAVIEIRIEDDRDFFRDAYYIATQRGCPYRCSYCSHSEMRVIYRKQKYVRRRSHDHVFAEMECMRERLDLDSVRLLDDVFLLDPPWVREFCERYPERIGLPFGCYAYPTAGVEEMLKWAREAGLAYVNVGLQSGSSYVMREIFNRKYDLEKTVRMCRKAADLGIYLVYDVLCFNPFENESHMRETLEFLMRLPAAREMHTFRLALFPGVRIETLDRPRYEEEERLRLFYAILYHATRHPDLPRETIRAMAENAEFRKDPEQMAQLLAAMIKDRDRIAQLEEANRRLEGRIAAGAGGDGTAGGGPKRALRERIQLLSHARKGRMSKLPMAFPEAPAAADSAGLSMPARKE